MSFFPEVTGCFLPVFTGLGGCKEGFQRRLAGVAEATERRPAQGVVLPGPALVLVTSPDLHPAGQVPSFCFCVFIVFFFRTGWLIAL